MTWYTFCMDERITLELAQRALDVILTEAKAKDYCIAIAVADANGDFIALARMDDAYLRWGRNARRKAYTSAIMGRDTQAFYEELAQRKRTLLEYGEPEFTTLPGGVAVYAGKRCIGAVGVTGVRAAAITSSRPRALRRWASRPRCRAAAICPGSSAANRSSRTADPLAGLHLHISSQRDPGTSGSFRSPY